MRGTAMQRPWGRTEPGLGDGGVGGSRRACWLRLWTWASEVLGFPGKRPPYELVATLGHREGRVRRHPAWLHLAA